MPNEPGTATGIYLTEASGGRGFRITVPANPAGRTTLKIFVGTELAQGRLTATLGGGETVSSVSFGS